MLSIWGCIYLIIRPGKESIHKTLKEDVISFSHDCEQRASDGSEVLHCCSGYISTQTTNGNEQSVIPDPRMHLELNASSLLLSCEWITEDACQYQVWPGPRRWRCTALQCIYDVRSRVAVLLETLVCLFVFNKCVWNRSSVPACSATLNQTWLSSHVNSHFTFVCPPAAHKCIF